MFDTAELKLLRTRVLQLEREVGELKQVAVRERDRADRAIDQLLGTRADTGPISQAPPPIDVLAGLGNIFEEELTDEQLAAEKVVD